MESSSRAPAPGSSYGAFSSLVQASAPDATCCNLWLGDSLLTAVHRSAPAHEFCCAASGHLVVMAVPQYTLTQALFDLGNGWQDHFCADPTPLHVLPSDTSYRWTVNGSSVVVMLALPMSLVEPLLAELEVPDAFERLSSVMDRGFSDPVGYDTVMRCWADARLQRKVPQLLLQSRIVCLLHALVSHHRPTSQEAGCRWGLGPTHLGKVLDLMHERMAEPLTLDVLASECGLSRFHFIRLFRGATGETPHQFLVRVRVERAKLLLSNSTLPIADVGAKVGYPDSGHFSRVFTKLTGSPPGRYRAERR